MQTSKRTILIVDDEVDLAEIMCFIFEQGGFNVEYAYNGDTAYNKFKSSKIDAVVTDVRMPKVSGIDLLKHIKKENPSYPPIFLITGFSDINEEEAKKYGASGLFKKPAKFDLLVEKVANEINQYKNK